MDKKTKKNFFPKCEQKKNNSKKKRKNLKDIFYFFTAVFFVRLRDNFSAERDLYC